MTRTGQYHTRQTNARQRRRRTGRRPWFPLIPRRQAYKGRFFADRTGAAALVSLAPAGGEGLGEGRRGTVGWHPHPSPLPARERAERTHGFP